MTSVLKKSSKAELKRQFKSHDEVYFRATWCPNWTLRKINIRQTNGVALSHPFKKDDGRNYRDSWLYFNKGDTVEIGEDGQYIYNKQLEYKFVKGGC